MAIHRQLAVRYALSENCIIWNMQTDISISPDMVLEFRFMLAGWTVIYLRPLLDEGCQRCDASLGICPNASPLMLCTASAVETEGCQFAT